MKATQAWGGPNSGPPFAIGEVTWCDVGKHGLLQRMFILKSTTEGPIRSPSIMTADTGLETQGTGVDGGQGWTDHVWKSTQPPSIMTADTGLETQGTGVDGPQAVTLATPLLNSLTDEDMARGHEDAARSKVGDPEGWKLRAMVTKMRRGARWVTPRGGS